MAKDLHGVYFVPHSRSVYVVLRPARFVVADNATEFWADIDEALMTLGKFYQFTDASIVDSPDPGDAMYRLMETKIEMAGIMALRKERPPGMEPHFPQMS